MKETPILTVEGFATNIEKDAIENNNFRKVVYTSPHMQLVLMSLKPGEEIGLEVHEENDQFFRFESGEGKCLINGTEHKVSDGDAIVIPSGAEHNVINTSKSKELKMYTIYAPPHHKDGIIMSTREEAESSHEEFDGETTE